MVRGSRCVFIVGFERCMTTSLAAYLVDNGYCSLLVDGDKEPHAILDPIVPALLETAELAALRGVHSELFSPQMLCN
jgi:hypothetical protein